MLEIELTVYEKLSGHGVDMTFEQARLLALQFLMGRERRKRQIGFSAYGKEGALKSVGTYFVESFNSLKQDKIEWK